MVNRIGGALSIWEGAFERLLEGCLDRDLGVTALLALTMGDVFNRLASVGIKPASAGLISTLSQTVTIHHRALGTVTSLLAQTTTPRKSIPSDLLPVS